MHMMTGYSHCVDFFLQPFTLPFVVSAGSGVGGALNECCTFIQCTAKTHTKYKYSKKLFGCPLVHSTLSQRHATDKNRSSLADKTHI